MDHSHHQHSHHHESLRPMAASATLHCLTGCAIGEIMGLLIGTALGFSAWQTLALAVALAFFFGYTLSTLPLLKAGETFGKALTVVFAADTLSVATMELVDNGVMAVLPGAMEAGLGNGLFWAAMALALFVAFLAAFPVNLALLKKGKGHALTHDYHGAEAASDWRRHLPDLPPPALAVAIGAFLLGGFIAAVGSAAESSSDSTPATHGFGSPAASLTQS